MQKMVVSCDGCGVEDPDPTRIKLGAGSVVQIPMAFGAGDHICESCAGKLHAAVPLPSLKRIIEVLAESRLMDKTVPVKIGKKTRRR